MTTLPLLISLVTGYLTLRLILKNSIALPTGLLFCLSVAAGLGISSSLTFYSFLALGKLNPVVLIGLHGLFLTALSLMLYRWQIPFWPSVVQNPFSRLLNMLLIFGVGVFIFVIFFVASKHPYGEWDAWGMWNLKTKFLILSEQPFKDILMSLHPYTHPDYPLFLPFLNVWLYSFQPGTLYPVPMIIAILVTVMCAITLYAGLFLLTRRQGIALLASLILISQPYFILTVTAQYADGVLAFYLLISIILLMLAMKTNSAAIALSSGLSLGMLSFIKNEGLVMAVLLLVLTLVNFLSSKPIDKKILIKLSLGFLLGALPTIIFKLILSPANQDILPNVTSHQFISDLPAKLFIISKGIFGEIKHEKWCGMWFFLILMGLFKFRAFFRDKDKILTSFFGLYFLIIIFVYLSSPLANLNWWVTSSLSRLYFSLMPSLIFLCFHVYWGTSLSDEVTTLKLPAIKGPAQEKFKFRLPQHRSQIYFIFIFLCVLILNLILLRPEIRRIQRFKQDLTRQTIGYQFAGLSDYFKNVDVIGYFTATPLTNPLESKLFAHAQITLAPVMLDHNNLNHEYILFVCPEQIAWLKIKELGAQPLLKNHYGMILAKRKR